MSTLEDYDALVDLVDNDPAGAIAQLPAGRYMIEVRDFEEALLGHVMAEKTKRTGIFRSWTTMPVPPELRADPAALDAARGRFHNWLEEIGPQGSTVLLWLLLDPGQYLSAYGIQAGRCGICHRPLDDPDSRARGIGPECIRKVPGMTGGDPR